MSQTDAELDAFDRLRRLTRQLNLDVATWRLTLALKGGYDPSQPRIPSGEPGGGQWTGGGEGSTGTKTPPPNGAFRWLHGAFRLQSRQHVGNSIWPTCFTAIWSV